MSSSNPEFGTSTEKETGFISGVTFGPKKVTYQVINGLAIFEGDIVLGTVEEVRKFTQDVQSAVVITSRLKRWPSGIVPFDIDPNLPEQSRITGGPNDAGTAILTGAIPHWEANTTIRFIRRTAENASLFPNFVFFEDLGGCFSPTGMLEGRRSISLHVDPMDVNQTCSQGNAIHEIGHTVGLFHEQSREKRDDFVKIHKENIIDDKEDEFDQHISDGDDVGDYDYCSIMHYRNNAWSDPPGNLITIEVLKPELLNPAFPCNGIIGQRNALSAGDMAAVNQMYGIRVLPRYGGSLAGFNNLVVGVSAMYNSDDRRHIVVLGTTDGKIHEIFWKSGQVGIEGNEQLPVNFGSGNIVSVSGFYNIHDQFHHAIVGLTNGKIHDIFWKSGQVGIEGNDELPVNLTSGSIVSVSGFYNSDDRRHFVIVGTRGGGVHEIFWKSDTPGIEGHNDLPAVFGFDGIVSVSGYYSSVDQLLNVIVGLRNGWLFDIHWKSGQAGIFGPSVLTPVPNTNSMIGAAGLFNNHDPRHIVIVGESGRIHELS